MATVTTTYGQVDKPELGGKRLVVQYGSAKFVKKSKTVSLKTSLKNVAGFDFTWKTGAPTLKASGAWVRTTGTVSGGKVVLTRATLGGATSGAAFWFKMVGW